MTSAKELNCVEGRVAILQEIEKDLVGPKYGPEEVLAYSPNDLYMTGILYPRGDVYSAELEALDEGSDEVEAAVPGIDSLTAEDVRLDRQRKPSSLGISFNVSGDSPLLSIQVLLGRYVKDAVEETDSKKRGGARSRGGFKRIAVERAIETSPDSLLVHEKSAIIEAGRAELRVKWRAPRKGCRLVTIWLINCQELKKEFSDAEDLLFQCSLRVRPGKGTLLAPYASSAWYSPDPEKAFLNFIYRKRKTLAVGHGISAGWKIADSGATEWIETRIIPQHTVRGLSFDIEFPADLDDGAKALKAVFLARTPLEKYEPVISSCEKFAKVYERWIDLLLKRNPDITKAQVPVAEAQIKKCRMALERIREGIVLLKNSKDARQCFIWMNEAMCRMWGRPSTGRDADEFSWRPFQLAFLLMNIPAMSDPRNAMRNTVDLIWFPTGGGKTEAYLALCAYTVFHGRKESPASGCCRAIMRYTLRTLTFQQFLRASALVCACDTIRREHEAVLGTKPIGVGYYVGEGSTPNSCRKAHEIYSKLPEDPPFGANPFLVDSCPWCGDPLVEKNAASRGDLGFVVRPDQFHFRCRNPKCSFHDHIPMQIVDEMIYREPPDLLIGTIDKFARLAWIAEPYGLFRSAPDDPPLSLIIQDELHLISGPLGTVAALYEMAIDHLASTDGVRPKVISATATIRRAEEQCSALFNREVQLFPPAGLTDDDSFFSSHDDRTPGRLYAGILMPARSPVFALVRLYAAILHAAQSLPLDEDAKDNFHTLVAYFNSIRELGKADTLASDDIPHQLKRLAKESGGTARNLHTRELRGTISMSEISEIMRRLHLLYCNRGAIDLLLTTNMISVGVDIIRLGLMVVNGQPRTTAEYIQASSRVGRQRPGLVMALYSPSKPRDRSHYERFTSFHSAFYRDVEPTSVTPFSRPARQRALHAAVVIMARSIPRLRGNDQAHQITEGEFSGIRNIILERVRNVDPLEEAETAEELDLIIDTWKRKAEKSKANLRYGLNQLTPQFPGLIKRPNVSGDAWPTMDNMRSVDSAVKIEEPR